MPSLPVMHSSEAISSDQGFEARYDIDGERQTAKDETLLIALPNEVLLNIFSSLDSHYGDRILGHNPNQPGACPIDIYLLESFLEVSKTYRALALTCRQFTPLAQECLLRGPIIHSFDFYPYDGIYELSSAPLLARTLLKRPELGKHIKQLRAYIPDPSMLVENYDSLLPISRAKLDAVLIPGRAYIETLGLSANLTKAWCAGLETYLPFTMVGLVLSLAPTVKLLSLSRGALGTDFMRTKYITYGSHEYLRSLFGLCTEQETHISLGEIHNIPAIQSLSYLKVMGPHPIHLQDLQHFPNLTTLDLSPRYMPRFDETHQQPNPFLSDEAVPCYKNIHHLRLDFQRNKLGSWAGSLTEGFGYFLRVFHNLHTVDMYAEPSSSKDPYWRTHFPEPAALDIELDPSPWNMLDGFLEKYTPVYESLTELYYRTTYADFHSILHNARHLSSMLTTLRLPGGLWTRPSWHRKPLPNLSSFTALRNLIVPQDAVISIELDLQIQKYIKPVTAYELPASQSLPASLQYFKVFDADSYLFDTFWLQELVEYQIECDMWPQLKTVEVLFSDFMDADFEDLMQNERFAELRNRVYEQMDKTRFKLKVGWDEEVPETDLSIC